MSGKWNKSIDSANNWKQYVAFQAIRDERNAREWNYTGAILNEESGRQFRFVTNKAWGADPGDTWTLEFPHEGETVAEFRQRLEDIG